MTIAYNPKGGVLAGGRYNICLDIIAHLFPFACLGRVLRYEGYIG